MQTLTRNQLESRKAQAVRFTRDVLDDPDRAKRVARVLTVGTPYWGSPKAVFPPAFGIESPFNKDSLIFGVDDLKKLERLDKLAHKIRSGAGGSDDDEVLENPPDRLADAVARLAEISDTLNKSVQKTSRLVISAAVIKHSNELIELIKRIRSIQQP